MPNTNWPLQSECDEFYGNPRGANGEASSTWEAANLVLARTPPGWQLVTDWTPVEKVKGIRVHRKVKDSLEAILLEIWEMCNRDYEQVKAIGMHEFGGGYNFRKMRGGNQLSMHSWGCAVDFWPSENAMHDPTPAMDPRVIAIFEKYGWEWGGHWGNKDSMHFQAAHTRRDWPKLGKVEPSLNKDQIKQLQQRLFDLGYKEIGIVDGAIGKKTKVAVHLFQVDNGIPVTEVFDAKTRSAMQTASPRQVSEDRANATAADLSDHSVVKAVNSFGGKLTKVAGSVAAVSIGSDSMPSGLMGSVNGALDHADQAKSTFSRVIDSVHGLFGYAASHPGLTIALIAVAVIVFWHFGSKKIISVVVDRFRDGTDNGG